VSAQQALTVAAQRHGLSAYLLEAVPTFSEQMRQRLKPAAQQELLLALKHKRLFLTVVDALLAKGIAPTALKGFALASRLYPNPLHRPSSDVDVLVDLSDAEGAQEALRQAGARQIPTASAHECSFEHPLGLVELHHGLYPSFGSQGLDTTRLTRRAETVERRTVQLFAPEAEFVALSVHAAQSVFLRASWLLDLGLFVHKYKTLDWPAVWSLAAQTAYSQAVAGAAVVLQETLEVEVPLLVAKISRARRLLLQRAFSARRITDASDVGGRLLAAALRTLFVESSQHLATYGVRSAAAQWKRLKGSVFNRDKQDSVNHGV
jgi:Uncharacterised nucleotidyltransferase